MKKKVVSRLTLSTETLKRLDLNATMGGGTAISINADSCEAGNCSALVCDKQPPPR